MSPSKHQFSDKLTTHRTSIIGQVVHDHEDLGNSFALPPRLSHSLALFLDHLSDFSGLEAVVDGRVLLWILTEHILCPPLKLIKVGVKLGGACPIADLVENRVAFRIMI